MSALVTNLECLPPTHGQPAAIGLRLDSGVDALGDPAGPAVLAERARLGQVGALDVWVVEFAHIPENPLPRQLRHGLLSHPVDGDRILPEPIEPSYVADVVLVEQNPLCIHDDRPGPEGDAVFSVNLRVFLSHLAVQLGPQV